MRKGQSSSRRAAKPLVAALLLVGAAVALLLALGRRQPTFPVPAPHEALQVAPRSALPATAWAILDVDLERLAELHPHLPRALGSIDCQDVAPPGRVALALLASDRPPEEEDAFDLLVAATETSPAFRACARRRMQAEAAEAQQWPGGIEVLSRPRGLRLLLRNASDLVLFASAPDLPTAELVEILDGTRPGAAESGHHALLLESLGPHQGLALTLSLPAGWLEGAVEGAEAARSPLRFLRAGALALRADALAGFVDCHATPDGSGCQELARFLESARDDLLAPLPPVLQQQLRRGWSLRSTRATRLALHWEVPASLRALLLSELLGR